MTILDNPRRRWFGYSLRTLFVVVAVVCVLLGWQTHVVQHRQAMLMQIVTSGGYVGGPGNGFDAYTLARRLPISPDGVGMLRRLMGDRRVRCIDFQRDLTAQDLRAIAAFPEALVQYRVDRRPHARAKAQ